jgi:hypothetical protein
MLSKNMGPLLRYRRSGRRTSVGAHFVGLEKSAHATGTGGKARSLGGFASDRQVPAHLQTTVCARLPQRKSTLVSARKRLELRNCCSAAYGSSICERVFAGAKSRDAPEPRFEAKAPNWRRNIVRGPVSTPNPCAMAAAVVRPRAAIGKP